MQNEKITNALIALNDSKENLVFEEENIWYSRKPEWAALIDELRATVKNEDIRGSIFVATDSDVSLRLA